MRIIVMGVAAGMLALAGSANAFSGFQQYIPFGTTVIPGGQMSTACGNCHGTSTGNFNSFGNQVKNYLTLNGNPNWAQLYNLDADNDGYTNGHELRDPNGAWHYQQSPLPNPSGTPSHPGNANSRPSAIQSLDQRPWAAIKMLFRKPAR